MAPEGYNPLDAGQIKGMLTGMKGAAEYEPLLDAKDFATRAAGSLSTSHLLIIVLIIIGNIGYISSRRRRQRRLPGMHTLTSWLSNISVMDRRGALAGGRCDAGDLLDPV